MIPIFGLLTIVVLAVVVVRIGGIALELKEFFLTARRRFVNNGEQR